MRNDDGDVDDGVDDADDASWNSNQYRDPARP